MLSTENPPPDLQCPCEISQLKSRSLNNGSDERTSDDNQRLLEEDLLNSGLDDNKPLSKFSIRDYVFNTRAKDIRNNWPFSQKNLQLCLKYGVKDVLPPFQSLVSVRNPSLVKVENISYSSDRKLSELSENSVGQNLAVDTKNISSSGFEEDKEFLATTASQSCSDLNSVRLKNPCSVPEADFVPGSPMEQGTNKNDSDVQNAVKKCRLIVKLNNTAESKLNEESAVNALMVSETMATKVCPVCKTFSSSSNTTLNAHIDQCLSGEFTISWKAKSEVIKHRIKPRKTRLIVDIYETALHCTLEDPDRRNGTHTASNLVFPAQDLKLCAEEKSKMYESPNIKYINGEGAVYIDSDGTKLRILSKLSDLPSNANANNDCGPSKFGKRDELKKFLSSKKKKYVVQKHKTRKIPHRGQGGYSSVSNHCPEVENGHRKNSPPEGYRDDISKPVVANDQMKSDGLGTVKHWLGSKQTVVEKKTNLKRGNQNPCKNLRVRCGALSLGGMFGKKFSSSMSPISPDENPLLPTEGHKTKENFCNSRDGCTEKPCQRKKLGFSSLKSQDCYDRHHLIFSKFNIKQSSKDYSVQEDHISPPNGTRSHVFSQRNNKMGINFSPAINANGSFMCSRSFHHSISPGSKKFASMNKKLLSVNNTSVTKSKKNLGRKHLDFRKLRQHYSSGSEEEVEVSRSANCRPDNLGERLRENAAHVEKAFAKSFIARARVLKFGKKREGWMSSCNGDSILKCSKTSSESNCHGFESNNSFSGEIVSVGVSGALEEVQIQDEFACEPAHNVADGETFVAVSRSLETAFTGLPCPDVGCVSQNYNKAYKGHFQTDVELGGEQEMFCANKFSNNLINSNSPVVVEMDANESQGNFFMNVDPIPIPGPPGSFLPSPDRMGSEELLGNSSLTSCRIQSSEEEREVVDMDSLDSAVSYTSGVSNFVGEKSDSVYINLSLQSNVVQHETQCGSTENGIESLVEGSTPVDQAATAERELNLHKSKSNVLPEMSTYGFKNIQPCCCSSRNEALQSGSLNYQESRLLRQKATTSHPDLSQKKQMADYPKNKIHCFNMRSETLPGKELIPEPEKIVANASLERAPVLASHHSVAKFPNCGDCESPSSSIANSVLRLMGKNLMVANKDENQSPQTRCAQSYMFTEHQGLRLCVDNGLPTSNNQNENRSFHHTLSQGPSVFVNMQTSIRAQHFDFTSPDGFKILSNCGPLPLSAHANVMPSSTHFGGSFSCAGGGNLIHDQHGCAIRLDAPVTHDIEKVRCPVPQLRTSDASGNKHKEIIVIDDTQENKAHLTVKATNCEVNMSMESGESSVGISASMALRPVYNYRTRGYPICTGLAMAQNGNTQVPSSIYLSTGFL